MKMAIRERRMCTILLSCNDHLLEFCSQLHPSCSKLSPFLGDKKNLELSLPDLFLRKEVKVASTVSAALALSKMTQPATFTNEQ
jgi:hypothetical protein